jgi:hypothetical protein
MRKKNNSRKSTYKGQFPNNPNLLVQNVRKNMRTEIDGPTVDTFSTMDSTTSTGVVEPNKTVISNKKTKRPTKEKSPSVNISMEAILAIVFTIVSGIVGVVIYNHGKQFVAIEKDVDHIKENVNEQKNKIETVNEKTNSIDKKIDLLNQRIEMKK